METALAAVGSGHLGMPAIFCGSENGYGLLTPGAALAVVGLLVVASGILVARSGARRSAADIGGGRIKSRYAVIMLLIVGGCFITTFGVAFALSVALSC